MWPEWWIEVGLWEMRQDERAMESPLGSLVGHFKDSSLYCKEGNSYWRVLSRGGAWSG